MGKITTLDYLKTSLQAAKSWIGSIIGEITGTVADALEELDSNKADFSYCTCTTASSTAAKVATVAGGAFTLKTGAAVEVKFTNYNSASSPTLNVNGTGAKNIKMYGTTAPNTYMWQSGAVVRFVYDGTNWIMLNATQATTTYYGLTKLSSAINSTSTSLAATPSAVKEAYDLAATANNELQNKADSCMPIYTAVMQSTTPTFYITDQDFAPQNGNLFGIVFNKNSYSPTSLTLVKIGTSTSSTAQYNLKATCITNVNPSSSQNIGLGYSALYGGALNYLPENQIVVCTYYFNASVGTYDIIICDRTLFSSGYSNTSALPLNVGGTGVTSLASLKTNLGLTDSGWLTATATSAVTENTYLQYRKLGSQVFLRANIRTTITSGASTTLFTLPSGYRPTKTVIISIPNYWHKGCLMIGTDGTAHVEYVSIPSGASAGTNITASSYSVLIDTSFLCD